MTTPRIPIQTGQFMSSRGPVTVDYHQARRAAKTAARREQVSEALGRTLPIVVLARRTVALHWAGDLGIDRRRIIPITDAAHRAQGLSSVVVVSLPDVDLDGVEPANWEALDFLRDFGSVAYELRIV